MQSKNGMPDCRKGKYGLKSTLLIELDTGTKIKKQIKCLGREHAAKLL